MSIERTYTEEDLEDNDEYEKLFCPFCTKVGLYVILGKKILLPNEVKQPDYESWLLCSRCAEIIPIYQVEPEETIQDSVSTVESPFDNAQGQVLGVRKDSKSSRKKKKRQHHSDKEIDEEIRIYGEENVHIIEDSDR